jgi:hypothetical protein
MISLNNHLANGGYVDPRALSSQPAPAVEPRSVVVSPGAIVSGIDFVH